MLNSIVNRQFNYTKKINKNHNTTIYDLVLFSVGNLFMFQVKHCSLVKPMLVIWSNLNMNEFRKINITNFGEAVWNFKTHRFQFIFNELFENAQKIFFYDGKVLCNHTIYGALYKYEKCFKFNYSITIGILA